MIYEHPWFFLRGEEGEWHLWKAHRGWRIRLTRGKEEFLMQVRSRRRATQLIRMLRQDQQIKANTLACFSRARQVGEEEWRLFNP